MSTFVYTHSTYMCQMYGTLALTVVLFPKKNLNPKPLNPKPLNPETLNPEP